MNDARAITGSLVDVRNVNTHKCVRLIIDVPAEDALKVIKAFGWATMVNPVPVAVARLQEPKEVMQHTQVPRPEEHDKTRPRPSPEPSGGANSKKHWDEILPSQQAGILCKEPKFWMFLMERSNRVITNMADAATWVRQHCEVNTRTDLRSSPAALAKWRELVVDYRLWERAVV